ncbi:MAG TPA: hypothetical protein VM409_06125, partial [Chloroflexia bacterium]|nr:hypothetical protein [Chloroflexia bacterium]
MRVRQAWDFHVGAWLVWLAAALLGALTTRNPFYMGLVMLSALLVNRQFGRGSRLSPGHASGPDADQRAPGGAAFSLFMRAVAS